MIKLLIGFLFGFLAMLFFVEFRTESTTKNQPIMNQQPIIVDDVELTHYREQLKLLNSIMPKNKKEEFKQNEQAYKLAKKIDKILKGD